MNATREIENLIFENAELFEGVVDRTVQFLLDESLFSVVGMGILGYLDTISRLKRHQGTEESLQTLLRDTINRVGLDEIEVKVLAERLSLEVKQGLYGLKVIRNEKGSPRATWTFYSERFPEGVTTYQLSKKTGW